MSKILVYTTPINNMKIATRQHDILSSYPDENNGVDEAEDGVKNDDYFYCLVVHHLETVAGVHNIPDEAEDNDQEEEVREVAVLQIRKVEGLLVASLDVALLSILFCPLVSCKLFNILRCAQRMFFLSI